jgi:hypothetical protein
MENLRGQLSPTRTISTINIRAVSRISRWIRFSSFAQLEPRDWGSSRDCA